MAETRTRAGYARIALATIAILTGVTALLTPRLLAPRWDANDSASYPFRMFGIRTAVIGAALLLTGARRQVPFHAAAVVAAIWSRNTVLARTPRP